MYSRLMPSSPFRFLFWMRSRHSSGEQRKQMMPLTGRLPMMERQRESQTAYSASSKLPSRCMISPKMQRSARGDLSENMTLPESLLLRMASSHSMLRECSALSWNVKAHLLGSLQQRWRMFFPAVFSHSSTGSLITSAFSSPNRVLFPAPRFPSTEMIDIFNLITTRPTPTQILHQQLKFKSPRFSIQSPLPLDYPLPSLIPPPLPLPLPSLIHDSLAECMSVSSWTQCECVIGLCYVCICIWQQTYHYWRRVTWVRIRIPQSMQLFLFLPLKMRYPSARYLRATQSLCSVPILKMMKLSSRLLKLNSSLLCSLRKVSSASPKNFILTSKLLDSITSIFSRYLFFSPTCPSLKCFGFRAQPRSPGERCRPPQKQPYIIQAQQSFVWVFRAMICAPTSSIAAGSQLPLFISVPIGQVLSQLLRVQSANTFWLVFKTFSLVRLVHSKGEELSFLMPVGLLKIVVTLAMEEMGMKSCSRVAIRPSNFALLMTHLVRNFQKFSYFSCSFLLSKCCPLPSRDSMGAKIFIPPLFSGPDALQDSEVFFLKVLSSSILLLVFTKILPFRQARVGKLVSLPSMQNRVSLKYLVSIFSIFSLFLSEAWFSIDRMMGQWKLFSNFICSEKRSISFITSSNRMGLQRPLPFIAWVTIGVESSLWTSSSTHLMPSSRSSEQRETLQSLVSWLPLRQVLWDEKQKQSVRGQFSSSSGGWLMQEYSSSQRNKQKSKKLRLSSNSLVTSSILGAVIFCSTLRNSLNSSMFMMGLRMAEGSFLISPRVSFEYLSNTGFIFREQNMIWKYSITHWKGISFFFATLCFLMRLSSTSLFSALLLRPKLAEMERTSDSDWKFLPFLMESRAKVLVIQEKQEEYLGSSRRSSSMQTENRLKYFFFSSSVSNISTTSSSNCLTTKQRFLFDWLANSASSLRQMLVKNRSIRKAFVFVENQRNLSRWLSKYTSISFILPLLQIFILMPQRKMLQNWAFATHCRLSSPRGIRLVEQGSTELALDRLADLVSPRLEQGSWLICILSDLYSSNNLLPFCMMRAVQTGNSQTDRQESKVFYQQIITQPVPCPLSR